MLTDAVASEREGIISRQSVDAVTAEFDLEDIMLPVVTFPRDEILGIYAHYRDELIPYLKGASVFDELSPPAQVILDGLPKFVEANRLALEHQETQQINRIHPSVLGRILEGMERLEVLVAQHQGKRIDNTLSHSMLWHLGAACNRSVEAVVISIGAGALVVLGVLPPVVEQPFLFCAAAIGISRLNASVRDVCYFGEIRKEFDQKIHRSLVVRAVAAFLLRRETSEDSESSVLTK